ncbi:tRNA uracil 4-sulfurtransferase ThiI [Spiroplasma platyhelix]|uniref:Probable tRNA sulfurtransferase n=1 Tax=Spiroplasma platyhelix PALS-1 TaxID=1276218 RepID=A0A846U003_9MOLU|nr:tRNA uracil 4-sulfurtransferase ThiI [Spiroplasma platyhelix]MBE4703813.1 putative tRNA sulfurtransferase [Spiroplasma platyhelix PALS-1]NKE38186.1 tRNA 4-thiouridine(8) synthase ThiI [Spiroplasma platyhelix PALS-1]UJB29071.1 thiamine biosynthesis protein ThiI [Spiroplasma platyhelix PALS-1]
MEVTKVIIIHYDELVLKGKVVRFNFIKQLKNNISNSLKEFDSLKYQSSFTHIEISNFKISEWEGIKEKLSQIFGISNFSLVSKFPKDFDLIKSSILDLIALEAMQVKTFKLMVKRNDKSFNFSSRAMIEELATIILTNTKLKVDVQNPELKIFLSVNTDAIYFYTNKVEGAKGLPVGSSGRILLLLSGGIDSPVAAWKLMKRGLEVIFLHFATPPVTSEEALNKVKDLIRILKPYNNNKSNLYICDFLTLQNELMHTSLSSYRITLMRRMFIKIANQLSDKLGIIAIATGESVGQVASQTLASINVINQVSNVPILRPLITDDKLEIINLATKINTYQTSILPFDDCCSLFVPKNPTTQPKLEIAQKLEQELQELINLEELIKITTDKIIATTIC